MESHGAYETITRSDTIFMWLSQDVDSRDVFTTFLPDRGRFRACSMSSRVYHRRFFYPVVE